MSQSDLAQMLEISIWCLNRVEHNKRAFDTDWMALMPLPIRMVVKEMLTQKVEGIQESTASQADAPRFVRRAPDPNQGSDPRLI
jgi:ribosome-binding protein aMBF1 (putative translation factor)